MKKGRKEGRKDGRKDGKRGREKERRQAVGPWAVQGGPQGQAEGLGKGRGSHLQGAGGWTKGSISVYDQGCPRSPSVCPLTHSFMVFLASSVACRKSTLTSSAPYIS